MINQITSKEQEFHIVSKSKLDINNKALLYSIKNDFHPITNYHKDILENLELAKYSLIECHRTSEYKLFSEEIRGNEEILNFILKYNGKELQNAPEHIKDNDEFVRLSLLNGGSLKDASDRIKNDKEMVYCAICNNGFNLEYASDELRKDKDFVFSCLRYEFNVLQMMDDELRKDKTFMMDIAKNYSGWLIEWMDDSLQNDKTLIKDIIKFDPMTIQHINEDLRQDKEFVSELIDTNINCLVFLHEDLRNDRPFLIEQSRKISEELKGQYKVFQDIVNTHPMEVIFDSFYR